MTHSASIGFLAGIDLSHLRAKAHSPQFAPLLARLIARTKEQAAAARASGFSIYTGAIGWHDATPAVLEAALIALLDDDQDMLLYVTQCIDSLTAYAAKARQQKPDAKLLLIHSHARVAMAADMLRSKLPAEAMSRLLAFCRNTAIDYNPGTDGITQFCAGSNIQWAHAAQAGVCALLFGEDSAHPDWRSVVDRAIEQSIAYLKYGCDASGFSFEGTGYGHGVFAHLFPFVELLKRSGYADLYATQPRLRAIFESTFVSVFPDRTFLTNDNDVGLIGASSLFYFLFAHKQYADPAYLAFWHAYQGPNHPLRPYGDLSPWANKISGLTTTPLDAHSTHFFTFLYWDGQPAADLQSADRPLATYAPGTERVDIRTSWSTDAVYFNILGAGRAHQSQTHRHADAGHFSIFAHGEYLAIDTGRYNSNEDQHSVMLVEGKNQRHIDRWGMDQSHGHLAGFHTSGPLTYIRAEMAHMKNCIWADRHFLAINHGTDAAYLITLDNFNVDQQPHNYLWQLQAGHDCAITIPSNRTATLTGKRARLDITLAIHSPADFAQPQTLSLRQDMQEWQWPYGKNQPITGALAVPGLSSSVRRPRLLADHFGPNGIVMAVISPRKLHQAPLTVTQHAQHRTIHIEIKSENYTDTILAAPDRSMIITPQLRVLSELVFRRHDHQGQLIHSWCLNGPDIPLAQKPHL